MTRTGYRAHLLFPSSDRPGRGRIFERITVHPRGAFISVGVFSTEINIILCPFFRINVDMCPRISQNQEAHRLHMS